MNISLRLAELRARLWPWVRRREVAALRRAWDADRRQYEAGLRERDRIVEESLERIVAIEYDRDRGNHGGRYRVSVYFPAEINTYARTMDDIRYMASLVGRRVEREVASAQFIERAKP